MTRRDRGNSSRALLHIRPDRNGLSQETSRRGGFVEETRLYECDANDRLTTETVTDSGGPREIVYAYDGDGNMVSKNDPAPGAGLIEYESCWQ